MKKKVKNIFLVILIILFISNLISLVFVYRLNEHNNSLQQEINEFRYEKNDDNQDLENSSQIIPLTEFS